jgi:hypothetical protein
LQTNIFRNIDLFMHEHGFTLYDIQTYRYSRSALPAHFRYRQPSATITGQVLLSDTLYFRDLADPDYRLMHPFEADQSKLLTLCILFELFGLPDCAAELLVKMQADGEHDLPYAALLDALAPGGNYQAYGAGFDADPTRFYPPAT